MAEQARIGKGHSPTFVGDVMPQTAGYSVQAGDSWCDVSSLPYQLKIWNALTTSWVVLGLYPIGVPTPPPVITSPLTASATQNVYFTYQITATNSPFGWNATNLPAGLSVNTSTGLIYGTPTGSGLTNINLSATNMGGTGYQNLTLTIAAPPVPSGIAGYLAGGTGSYNVTTIGKLTFSNETSSVIGSGLSSPRGGGYGGVTATKGYVAGNSVNQAVDRRIDYLQFATETTVPIAAQVAGVFRTLAGNCQSSIATYAAGGSDPFWGTGYSNTIETLVFSSEITQMIGDTISFARGQMASGLQTTAHGYFAGGETYPSNFYNQIEKLVFSSEVSAQIASVMTYGLETTAGGSSNSAAYIFGGLIGINSSTSSVDKIIFASDSVVLVGNLPIAAAYACEVQNGTNAYITDGWPAYTTAVMRFTFAGETSALIASSMSPMRALAVGLNY